MAEVELQKTAFDTLLERMKKDVRETEERAAVSGNEGRWAADRLQGVLNAAIREARDKGERVRAHLSDGAEVLHEEMRKNPAATVSAAFAAGYLIGKTVAGRAKT
jgi:hypothetical protein